MGCSFLKSPSASISARVDLICSVKESVNMLAVDLKGSS